MKLERWLKKEGLTQSEFARIADLDRRRVWGYIQGAIPKPAFMQLIIEATKGEVGPADFYV